jgi:hypothetical protein
MNKAKLKLLAVFPLLVADAFGNLCVGGAFKNTLSGEASYHTEHKYWGWTAGFINKLFRDPKHCEVQAAKEKEHGSWYGYWLARWRAA